MTQDERHQLGKTLWAIADTLRGNMDADDFRDYMLAFLFLRYLSDNYEAAARKELGKDYPKEIDGSVATPLQAWYESNAGDVIEFEKQMRRKVHYVIEPQYLWANIAEMARVQDEDLLRTLTYGFKYMEEESFESTFQGLFSEINLTSEKLGKTYTQRNGQLVKIVSEIAKGLAKFSANSDALGDAYEYRSASSRPAVARKRVSSTRRSRCRTSFPASSRWTDKTRPPDRVRTWTRCWILPADRVR